MFRLHGGTLAHTFSRESPGALVIPHTYSAHMRRDNLYIRFITVSLCLPSPQQSRVDTVVACRNIVVSGLHRKCVLQLYCVVWIIRMVSYGTSVLTTALYFATHEASRNRGLIQPPPNAIPQGCPHIQRSRSRTK